MTNVTLRTHGISGMEPPSRSRFLMVYGGFRPRLKENHEIAAITETSPEVKKAVISNLYEAIQLYQIGDFASDTNDDKMNVKVYNPVSGYSWEKHCPGYYAVLINRANCSTAANWLIYLLSVNYEDWGTLHYQRANGGGHVINYFISDGYYYFIDMTHYPKFSRNL